jgi:TrmH family RNA methyltransferase
VNPLRVVLVAPRNPLNIGAAARAMSNFGVFSGEAAQQTDAARDSSSPPNAPRAVCGELRLVNPYEVAFREARSAVKAQHVLRDAREFATVAEAVADCGLVVGTTSKGLRALEHPLRRLEYGGRLIAKKLASTPVALLFGSEKFGLSNDDLSHCHWLMRIPTRAEHGSMNLGQSVAVCLYEIVRSPAAARATPEARRPAASADLERLKTILEEVLELSGYVHARVEASTSLKVRRLVRRLDLNQHDAEVWLGMLRQIRWKLLS